jgi:hypothetical protein
MRQLLSLRIFEQNIFVICLMNFLVFRPPVYGASLLYVTATLLPLAREHGSAARVLYLTMCLVHAGCAKQLNEMYKPFLRSCS